MLTERCLFVLSLSAVSLSLSCVSLSTQEERLSSIRSTTEIRLSQIEREVQTNPAYAIHLIEAYHVIYGQRPETSAYREQATERLVALQEAALSEGRWDDAASLARSLAVLGISVSETGQEREILLNEALQNLEAGNDLRAFLSAVRADSISPLDAKDALPFLDRAYEIRQRRTAAFFLNIIDNEDDQTIVIADEVRSFAGGQDTASDMIKGVATVIVDRGYRIEKGRGLLDMVIGSAFFVDSSGLMITNYHVIASEVDPEYEGYSRAYIRTGDASSTRIPVKVIGWDKALDLALIEAQVKPDYVFSIIDRAVPLVGESIYAIGSPAGLEKTVTQGIVSALGRRFLSIGDCIQIDAAVNHGNSGGPVVDKDGRLVGIVFAGVDQFQGLNFAVPAERLAAALPALIDGGNAERPWLGLTLNETEQGTEIIYVAPFTPASEQRVPEGLGLSMINGQKVDAPQGMRIPAWQDLLFPTKPGELVSITLADGTTRIVQSVVRTDVPLAQAAQKDRRERIVAPLFGLILGPSIEGYTSSSLYLVKKVIRGSAADDAGLSVDDPVSIRTLQIMEDEGYALVYLKVRKRRAGFFQMTMPLLAILDSPNTL
ncbi:MAG: S1C family serine protease [Spirochaetaceae bacterium]|jgi:S1-C subfamily serine protease|nr:S1C family serine protease [Spirochaetaceae bacterium]